MKTTITIITISICLGMKAQIQDTGDKVGIGELIPQEKLHVNGNGMIQNYSPLLKLKRNTDIGGFIQGIQTQYQDGSPNFYFGNLHDEQWIISKGEYNGDRLLTVKSDGKIGIKQSEPEENLHVNGNGMIQNYSPLLKLKRNTDIGGFIQGIQTQYQDGAPNFYFGNLHGEQWIISKGEYNGDRLLTVKSDGNVGIGTTTPGDWKLAVNGNIRAKEIKVETGWSDFVFYDNYELPTLLEVENHIKEKGHLKDIPSAKEVEKNGILLGEMDSKLLQKIEELTLYTIAQEKKIEKQEKDLERLKLVEKRLSQIEKSLNL